MSRNIYYWGTPSFSGPGQFNEGPFVLGTVARLLKAKVTGALNYQGVVIGSSAIYVNSLLWGLQVVPHGAGPLDVILSTDNDNWLIRQQTGSTDIAVVWAPNTANAATLTGLKLTENWRGQAQWNESLDAYLSLAPSFGGSTPDFGTYGTAEFWWS